MCEEKHIRKYKWYKKFRRLKKGISEYSKKTEISWVFKLGLEYRELVNQVIEEPTSQQRMMLQ